MTRPDITRLLTLAAIVWLERRGGAVFTEAQVPSPDVDHLRLDVVHVGARTRDITAIEVKSCREDFREAQYRRYLENAPVASLYIASLPGVFGDEQFGDAGLLELNTDWPLVRINGVLTSRTAENQPLWQDVFIQRLPAPNVNVTEKHELTLLRALVLHGHRINSRDMKPLAIALEVSLERYRRTNGATA